MKAKEFLLQVKKLDRLIHNKLIEKDKWINIASGLSSPAYGDRVQSSGNPQRMEESVCRYIDIESEIDRMIDDFVDKKQNVISTIEMLPEIEYDMIFKIYIQGMNFYDAAEAFDKSYSWVTTVHGRALKHLQDMLDGIEKERIIDD